MNPMEKALERFDCSLYRDRNVSMLTDYYQLMMMYGYYKNGRANQRAVFDLFFRRTPGKSGYAIAAGLEEVIWFLLNLRFSEVDLAYIRSLGFDDEGFLTQLKNFKFNGTVYAIPEGTVVFGNEPLLRFEGRIFELQFIESAILAMINHQTLIATKASRILHACNSEVAGITAGNFMEFGLRRAHNADAAVFGARAAYIGGCEATSNLYAGQSFKIPVAGTMAHSWIQSFPSELDAFRAYAHVYPDRSVLLVDTYNVLEIGVPHAIQVAKELRAQGHELKGIRLDSGDLTYLSKEARRMLDEAGFLDVQIVASSDLDEYTIRDLLLQGARIDAWGVGTHLITSKDSPSLGGVYKLVSEEEEGEMHPSIKVSENEAKITTPGKKRVVRIYNQHAMATADLILMDDEQIDTSKPITLFDPVHTYKKKTLSNYTIEELLKPIFVNGTLVYELPDLKQIRERRQSQLTRFYPEVKRTLNPHVYHVDLSQTVWDLKHELILSQLRH